jgi:hypothetical protein
MDESAESVPLMNVATVTLVLPSGWRVCCQERRRWIGARNLLGQALVRTMAVVVPQVTAQDPVVSEYSISPPTRDFAEWERRPRPIGARAESGSCSVIHDILFV